MFNQQPKTTNHTFVTGPRALGGPKGANNLLLKSFTSIPDASQLKSSSPFRHYFVLLIRRLEKVSNESQ